MTKTNLDKVQYGPAGHRDPELLDKAEPIFQSLALNRPIESALNNLMKKIIFLIVASVLLVSCTSVNPYNLTGSEGAYLKNREEFKDKTTSYLKIILVVLMNTQVEAIQESFQYDIRTLQPSAYNSEARQTTAQPSIFADIDEVYVHLESASFFG